MKRFLMLFFALALVLGLCPAGRAAECPDLTGCIRSRERRRYVRSLVGYYLSYDETVRSALDSGGSALFFFEGCSDNMLDRELSDLSYYRVSALGLAIALDDNGEPELIWSNKNCSTLPDRPLEYGAWRLDGVGEVGPATVCDGTYEAYSVRHAGAYEALHLRTEKEDGTLSAVYMTPGGFTPSRADEINIHTRTGNHTIEGAMWSAGCLLVGDGDFSQFTDMMAAVYDRLSPHFETDVYVGSVTIDRSFLREELLPLYENQEAVDTLLCASRLAQPEIYLRRCEAEAFPEPRQVRAVGEAVLYSLPCIPHTDARSVRLTALQEGDTLQVTGSLRNPQGSLWYRAELAGEEAYVYAGDVKTENPSWLEQLGDWIRKRL